LDSESARGYAERIKPGRANRRGEAFGMSEICFGTQSESVGGAGEGRRLEIEQAYRHRGDLQRMLMARLKSEEQVKEIVQETFARFLTIEDTAKIGNPRGYLFRMAVNLSIDQARCARTSIFSNAVELEEDMRASDGPTPEDNLQHAQLQKLFAAALSELPQRSRELFYLHRFEGLSTLQIARQFGISQRMVQKSLARAMKHFNHRLTSVWAA
jgi:RNA polymerase sigma factor (sigma-70 family)